MNCIGIDLYDISPNALAFSKSPEDNFLGFIPTRDIHPVGFAENEEVIPRPFKQQNNLNTPARHLMREFSLYPQKFMFMDIKNVAKVLKGCGNKLQIRLHLKKYIDYNSLLFINKTQNCFQIGATPVVNLLHQNREVLEPIEKNELQDFISIIDENQNSFSNHKNYVYHISTVKLLKNDSTIINVKSPEEFSLRNSYKWKPVDRGLFSDPFAGYSKIEIIKSNGEAANIFGLTPQISFIAHNNITQEEFKEIENFQLGNKKLAQFVQSIQINNNSFFETKQNPHLLKGPLPFLQKLHMSNFYHFDNLSRTNLNEYLETFITNEIDTIQKFNGILEYIETLIITGEGRLPPKQTETFITNGLKFCFEFNVTNIKVENKYIKPEIFLLMHIIGEHLSEMCSDLSFVKLSYKFYSDHNNKHKVEENYFNKKIYLGKRSY